MTFGEILADFEDLEEDDLKACLAFAAKMAEIKSPLKLMMLAQQFESSPRAQAALMRLREQHKDSKM